MTIAVTCALSAWPEPVTAALTSLGVYVLHRQPGPGGGQHRDRAGLRGAHHGAHVVLAEHPLDGDAAPAGARRSARSSARSRCSSRSGRSSSGSVWTTSYATSAHGRPGTPLDDADAAPGQPRVDAEHPHAVHLPGRRTRVRHPTGWRSLRSRDAPAPQAPVATARVNGEIDRSVPHRRCARGGGRRPGAGSSAAASAAGSARSAWPTPARCRCRGAARRCDAAAQHLAHDLPARLDHLLVEPVLLGAAVHLRHQAGHDLQRPGRRAGRSIAASSVTRSSRTESPGRLRRRRP